MAEPPNSLPPILSPSSSGRRRTSTSNNNSNSPEFEFWIVRPEPELLSADQLFSHGVLLPLHNLNLSNDPPTQPEPAHDPPQPPGPESLSATSSSKRWRDIFKTNTTKEKDNTTPKEKKREMKKSNGATNGVNGAELNINIWPFSRSRSAGNNGNRPRSSSTVARKVSSAPCSRSNSSGESKSKKWPGSPIRGAGGVHLGRNSPVWHLKVAGKNEGRRKIPAGGGGGGGGGGGSKVKALSLNVPMCMGYREHLSCRGFESSVGEVNAGGQSGVEGEGVRGSGSNFFNIRGLFGKKVY